MTKSLVPVLGKKNIYKTMIIDYLSDPENPPLPRSRIAIEVLGIKPRSLYNFFRKDELDKIEAQGLQLRRSRLATFSVAVDQALFKRACQGDVAAIKLWYQRMERWSEKTTVMLGEPTDDDIRQMAISKGYDPDEYLRLYKAKMDQNADSRVH